MLKCIICLISPVPMEGIYQLSRYVGLDINFFSLKVLKVVFLVIQNQNDVLDPKHCTKLPGIIRQNLVKLVY